MTGTLAICRNGASGRGAAGTLDKLSAVAAILTLMVSTAAGVLEQSSLDDGRARGEAAEGEPAATSSAGESLVGAYAGAPYTYPSAVRIETPDGGGFTVDPVQWRSEPFRSPIYYGARLAHWGGRAGAMVDFIHSKAMANLDEEASFSGTIDGKPLPPRARISDIFRKLEFSHGHNMLLLNGLLRLPAIGPRLSPYAGAGAGVLLPHTEVELRTDGRGRTYEYNYAGPAAQALVGLEVRFRRVSFFVEYKFTFARYAAPLSQLDGSWLGQDLWRQFNRWLRGEKPPGGHVLTDLASHQVVSGLAVRLAPRPAAP